jgi:hypothetical protein
MRRARFAGCASQLYLDAALFPRRFSGSPVYRQLLAKVYSALGNFKESQQLGPDPWLKVFNALHEAPPNGFTAAIEKGEALAALEGVLKSASLHLWLARAYGQKFAYEQKNAAPPDRLAATRAHALTQIQTAIAVDASVRSTLQSTWDAPAGTVDNDLAVFKDDPAFRALLGST